MIEKTIQADIFRRLGSLPNIRIFRNNVGVGFQGRVIHEDAGIITLSGARRIRFGLHTGSGDLIGWKSTLITTDMVGKKIAQIVSIETKTKTGRPTDEQTNWRDQIISAGGIAGIVRSTDEAIELII